MLQMASALQGAGGSPLANPFGAAATPSFPAPGNPNAPSPTSGLTSPNAQSPAPNPFNLFGMPGAGSGPSAGGAGAAPNPFAFDPALMQQMMGMNAFGPSAGGFGTPPAPADTRPPEERFQVQLQVSSKSLFTAPTPSFPS